MDLVSKHGLLVDSECGGLFLKDELVGTRSTTVGCEPGQFKTAVPIEIEYLFGRCHFERIAAQPIDNVMKGRHASFLALLGIVLEWIPTADQISLGLLKNQKPTAHDRHGHFADGAAAIDRLDLGPCF